MPLAMVAGDRVITGHTTRRTVWLPLQPMLSVAVRVTSTPAPFALVALPPNAPVEGFSVSPVGRLPLVTVQL
ncbi:hypothetical protein GCM10023213_45310 [Prosthecobacter algae]|uniref:Uncharacterized protein n=1 Tax=Prosthecobacter algae TaxID=1144682 RepID=A0ABP9PPW3_9BACT